MMDTFLPQKSIGNCKKFNFEILVDIIHTRLIDHKYQRGLKISIIELF